MKENVSLKQEINSEFLYKLIDLISNNDLEREVEIEDKNYQILQNGLNFINCTPLELTYHLKLHDNEIINILLKNGSASLIENLNFVRSDVNLDDKSGQTPFYYAVKNGNHGIVKTLIKRDVNLNLRTNKGKRLLHYAIMNNQLEIVQKLLKGGANFKKIH